MVEKHPQNPIPIGVHIRHARPQDLSVLVSLFRAHLGYHATFDPRYDPPDDERLAEFFQDRLREPETLILVAQIDEGVAGYILVQMRVSSNPAPWWQRLLQRFHTPRLFPAWPTVGYIADCFVAPDSRRQGLGRQLVEQAFTWCQQRGAKEVELGVLPGNQAGRDFWEALGFAPCRIEMRRQLGEEKWNGNAFLNRRVGLRPERDF